MSLTEYFKSQYRILLDCYGHDRLYFRFVDLKEENARRRMKLFLVRQERSELYKSVIQEISALQNLEKLNLSIEKIQEEYYRKKLLIGRGYAVSDELRREIIGLESQLNSLLNDRRGKYQWLQVNAGTIGTKITAYDRDIEDKIQSLQELIVEETRVRQEYEALSITKEQVTPERKSTFLDECLKIIRNMIMVAGKQEKKEATPWLQREIPFDLVEQLGEFLVQSCKFDRDLFNNCKARFNRLPWILLLPSEGNGFYDSHTNILFLPLLSPRAPEVSFLTALGHYKWQMDDTEKISQLYRRLGQNRLLSPAQLEQKFITQYYIYLMGSADEEELDEESSRWFTNFLCRSEKTDSELASETTREPTSVVKDPVVEKKHKRENLNLFDLRVKDLQDKIRKSTEIKELDSMLEIRQSQQEKGKIDIIIKNVDPVDSRLETLLSVLTLQARLSRFNDLNV
jgi:hypothetical protein